MPLNEKRSYTYDQIYRELIPIKVSPTFFFQKHTYVCTGVNLLKPNRYISSLIKGLWPQWQIPLMQQLRQNPSTHCQILSYTWRSSKDSVSERAEQEATGMNTTAFHFTGSRDWPRNTNTSVLQVFHIYLLPLSTNIPIYIEKQLLGLLWFLSIIRNKIVWKEGTWPFTIHFRERIKIGRLRDNPFYSTYLL